MKMLGKTVSVFKCCSPSNLNKVLCPDYDNSDEFNIAISSIRVEDSPNDTLSWTYVKDACDRFIMDSEWKIYSDGSLFAEERYIPSNLYCLDVNKTVIYPYVCFEEETSAIDNSDLQYAVYPYGMILSLPFFFINLLVYLLIEELRRKAHGKAFVCLQASMIVGYSLLITNDLDWSLPDLMCLFLAYIVQFAFLATFFWMNVMCFDIWWTFSSLKKPGGSVRERDLKKFLLYSVYAWGFPLLILIATLIAEYSPMLDVNSDFRPDMGVNKCFFRTAASTWLFMYGPIAILIIANLIMFAFTAKKIFLHTRETQVLKSEDSKRHDSKDRERFNLYLKLFIVMGVNWVAELISWADASNKVFYITDITNTLQGFIIFVIFVCKRRVLRLLEASLCPKRAARRNAHNSSSRSRNTMTSVVNGSAKNGAAQTPETMQLRPTNDSDTNV